MTTALIAADLSGSPFAGADICQEARLALPTDVLRPCFDDDLWDSA